MEEDAKENATEQKKAYPELDVWHDSPSGFTLNMLGTFILRIINFHFEKPDGRPFM